MFDENEHTTNGIRLMLAAVARMNRGDVILYTTVAKLTGINRQSPNWTQFIRRLRRELRQTRGVTLTFVTNVGYRLDPVKDQLHTRSIHRQRKALRQMDRDVKELDCLPNQELSDHERAVKCRKIDQGKTGKRAVLYSLRLGHKLSKPSGNGIPRSR